MTPRTATAFKISLAAGLIVLALTVVSILQDPARPCGALRAGYAPIIAFELARSQADLDAIFGASGDCRTGMIARMDTTNVIDALVFVPVYSMFLIFFMLGMRERSKPLAAIGVVLALLAGAGDYAENLCLMQITPALDAGSFWFALLPWVTGVKWLSLGAVAAVAGLIYAQGQPRNPVATVICALSALTTIAAIAVPASYGHWISLAIAVSWLTFLISAAAGSRGHPVTKSVTAG